MHAESVIRARPARASGFTLLEVLVALLLLSLALVALVRAAGLEARALTQMREATVAQWVAANVIAETRLSRTLPAQGRAEGRADMGGQRWRWQLDVQATDEAGLFRLDVRVHADAAETDAVSASLTGFVRP